MILFIKHSFENVYYMDEQVVKYLHLSLGKMRRCVKITEKAIGVPLTYIDKLWIEMGRSIPLTKGTL